MHCARGVAPAVLTAALLGAVALAGCTHTYVAPFTAAWRIDNAAEQYAQAAQHVGLGDSEADVLSLLEPTQAELLPSERKPSAQFIRTGYRVSVHYFRSRRQADRRTTDDEFTPYVFVDGELAAVGWAALGGPPSVAQPPAPDASDSGSDERPAVAPGASTHGQKVYDASECVGPVVNGVCEGSIVPNKAYHPTCYGEMINGRCTGPQF